MLSKPVLKYPRECKNEIYRDELGMRLTDLNFEIFLFHLDWISWKKISKKPFFYDFSEK